MANIAVLAWGSLVWDPRDLKVAGPFTADGPYLPIEFGRISRDGRITLVIDDHESVPFSRTYVAPSSYKRVSYAKANLHKRETGAKRPHYYSPGVVGHVRRGEWEDRYCYIYEWAELRQMDNVIFTNLKPNIPPELDVIAHIESLNVETRIKALEYVWRAPPTIQTPRRRMIMEHFSDFKLEN